jgi:Xaa-Pro aminopeptidase
LYASRRKALLSQLGNGVAVIPTATEKQRNSDAHYAFRYDSYFWYLTGFSEPESALVLIGGDNPQSILFCRDKDETREIWDGFRYGPEGAKSTFGFDAAYSISELDSKLPDLIANRATLWHSLGHDAVWDARISAALNVVRGQNRAGKRAPGQIHDLRASLDAMRLIKDSHEIATMKRAADISSAAHAQAMRTCKTGLHEYVLEAELSYAFRKNGADAHAYTPIVAGGSNACVLHYIANNQPLQDGSLVLIDAGCEVEGYASDITRTFPVNGRFSAVQRDVYEIVLAAQSAAFAVIKPGSTFIAPHEAALKTLTQGMVDLGLLKGNVDGLIESEAYKPFFMHRTGHWLGLDVHDVGEYKDGEDWIKLRAGMALTVEPGIYIRAAENVPQQLHGIGIRIEDDVLVTEQGCDVYTSAPKTVAEIEAVMRS